MKFETLYASNLVSALVGLRKLLAFPYGKKTGYEVAKS